MGSRKSRLKIMLGACIICTIGVVVDSKILSITALLLVLASCIAPKEKPLTNYTDKFGPPDGDEESSATPFNTTLPEEDTLDEFSEELNLPSAEDDD